jgi:nitroimidazol reductase NimA-like FMN-containing flavoprotein (pyridoxamine 5'-phosphate oxidase superfamily)
MPVKQMTEKIRYFLERKEFLNAGTCDLSGKPNVAPKFLVAVRGNFIYLADYVLGRTYSNLKVNPRISLATVDMDTLVGYQINGKAKIIEKGGEYDRLMGGLRKKTIEYSVSRIIEGVRKEKGHKDFEVNFPERIVVFKVAIEEIVTIYPSGKLQREQMKP